MIAQATPEPPHYPTARDFFRRCYKPLRLRGKSEHSVRLHECTLNNLAKHLEREATLDDLNSDTLTGFLAWMSERGRAPGTVNDNQNRVMALARFAVKKRVLLDEPDIQPLPEPERVPRAWMDGDLSTLMGALAAQRGFIGTTPAGLWWKTLHLVLLFTGERISAVLSLRWDQVDLDGAWVVLSAEQRKGGKRDKEWPLPVEVVEALRTIKQTACTDLVFKRPFSLGTVYNRYRKILRAAGLPYDRKSKFHRMRKTTASQFAAAGGNATELLDHSSAKVTKRYLDLRIVKQQSASDLLSVPVASRYVPAIPESRTPKPISAEQAAMPIGNLVTDWLAYRDALGLSGDKRLEVRVRWAFEFHAVTTVGDLDKLTGTAAMEHSRGKSTSDRTRFHYRNALIWFLTWLVKERGISGPAVACLNRLEDEREVTELSDADFN